MYTTGFAFLLLLMGFVWVCVQSAPTRPKRTIDIREPIFQRNCLSTHVSCVNDCSFLCVEDSARCVGGTCVVTEDKDDTVPCDRDKGGVRMLVNDPAPRWKCLCTDATFFGGSDCSRLNPDVCEHGVFLYSGPNKFLCLCPEPYESLMVGGKPHCVEQKMARFFRDEDTDQLEELGPHQMNLY